MAVWSSLAIRNIEKLNLAKHAFTSFKNEFRVKTVNEVPVRKCHERRMIIKSSTFQYTKFKDLVHFYIFIGAVPLIALITYVNLFIGPAELALIPEGYEPKPYEYYRHPISRFFAKYITTSHQERYERNLHHVFYNNEKAALRKLTKKIQQLIKEREDYQAWYYDRPAVKYVRKMREDIEKRNAGSTSSGGWVF